MAKRIVAVFLVLVFALSLFSCEEQDTYTENVILDYSFTQDKDDYSIKIIERSAGEGTDSYVCQYIFEVLGPVENQTKKYIYETKRYSRYSAPETFEEFIRKDSVLKEITFEESKNSIKQFLGIGKVGVYEKYLDFQNGNNIFMAAVAYKSESEDYLDFFSDQVTKDIQAAIMGLKNDFQSKVKDDVDLSEPFEKIYVEKLVKENETAFKSYEDVMLIADFVEALNSGVDETSLLLEVLNEQVDFFTKAYNQQKIKTEASTTVTSHDTFLDFVKNKFVTPEASVLCKALLSAFKNESKNKRLTIVDVKPDSSNEKGDSTQNTYTTNMSKIQSEKYAYPTFSFTCPSGWSVEKDEIDPTRTDYEYEWLVLKNKRGVEITYYQNDFGFQQYYSAMGICEGTLTKVSDSDFVPTSISGADYSSLGKFVVAKLEVHTVMDHVTGEKSPSASDDPMYAVVPESYLGETSFSGSGYYGALSWEYPSPISVFASFPQGSNFTEQEEKEVIEILSSFKEVPDPILTALRAGDFSAFDGTYNPVEEYVKDMGYTTDFGELTLHKDGKISATGISCPDNTPISVIKQKDGSYRCMLQENRKKVEGPAYDYWEGTNIEIIIYPAGIVGEAYGVVDIEGLKNTVYIQYEAYSSGILAMLYCLDDSNS